MSLFEGVVQRNDEIEDDGKRVENLIRGILAGNIFDLGSAQVCWVSFWASLVVEFPLLVFCYCCYVEAQATLCRISYVESTKQSWYFFFQVLLNSNIYTVKQMLFLLYSMKLLHAWTSNNSFFSCILKLAEVFAKDGMSFLASCQNLVSRPWVIDDLDAFKSKWTKKSWEKVLFYCCVILLPHTAGCPYTRVCFVHVIHCHV